MWRKNELSARGDPGVWAAARLPRERTPAPVPLILARRGSSAWRAWLRRLVGSAAASDPYVAGQAATRSIPLPAAVAAQAMARSARAGAALGLPAAARRTVERLEDRPAHVTYDEVTDLDARGRPAAVLRYSPDGRLVAAVHLGWLVGRGLPLQGTTDAIRVARTIARAVGIEPSGSPTARVRSANGWAVSWTRTVDGVPVPGDGLRIQLWPDCSFHSLSTTEHALAAPPAPILSEGDARTVAVRYLDRWIPSKRRAEIGIVDAQLAWIAPNDTFDAARPDAPADVLRLAWVVRAGSQGGLAEGLRGLEIAIDAGDASLLGGDVLR